MHIFFLIFSLMRFFQLTLRTDSLSITTLLYNKHIYRNLTQRTAHNK